MNDAGNARQQIVEKIKGSSNILVTVSSNPSVDALSAALGLTLMLNKLGKHATSVFSGEIPPAISFLDPSKTFEDSVDSLRDFIIALDKEKADHLRYRLDGDVVKIFITPYKTTISERDLEFSQGDYNVELVIAIGVNDKQHLDKALEAHGRILHDAAVASIDAGSNSSSLGNIAWQDTGASSLCEMLVGLGDSIKDEDVLLDDQTATALLTGIVAETDRFSNNKTSSKTMTIAAQLMAAGANQQLIAAKLESADEIQPKKSSKENSKHSQEKSDKHAANQDGTMDLSSGVSTKIDRKTSHEKEPEVVEKTEETKKADGALVISHETAEDSDYVASVTKQVSDFNSASAQAAVEDGLKLSEQASEPEPEPAPDSNEMQYEEINPTQKAEQILEQELSEVVPGIQLNQEVPSIDAAIDAAQLGEVKADDIDKKIINHQSESGANAHLLDRQENQPFFNSAAMPSGAEPPSVDPFEQKVRDIQEPSSTVAPAPEFQPSSIQPEMKLNEIDAANRANPDEAARAAVDAALSAAPATPSFGGMPPLPDFSTLPPPPPPLYGPPAQTTVAAGALPPEQLADIFAGGNQPTPVADPGKASDPGQFKIPGQ